MALAGTGAVAIWHDIAPEGRAEFYAWHGREHMPERVGIPGFRRGRRYVAAHGTPEFFNLYETATPAVVVGSDYLRRLNDPTPWTLSTVRHFRSVARSLCEVAASAGEGQGGSMATFRYAVADAAAASHRARLCALVPEIANEAGVAGCHFLVADEAASAVETTEKKVRAEKNLVPRWIVLVEGWGDEAAFVDWCTRFAQGPAFADASAPDWAVYRLQNARDRLGEAG
ncbi:MAG TPA: hypothetical protein VGI14_20760 [Casimicrobiaceae bacterium]|jgi:hypothetical protein